MDKKTAGLIGVVAAMASVGTAQASTPVQSTDAMKVESYADLLRPIPNATAALRADDAVRAERAATPEEATVQVAQYYHHHHHHHRFFRRFYHHHHHHHRFFRRFYHHHHHYY